ncbi:MAG: hypothetical protein WC460_00020 [Patescibacteria group bacterium]
MKKNLSLVMACVFIWANTAFANYPGPDVNSSEAPATDNVTYYVTPQPVLSWTKGNILEICQNKCGQTDAEIVYASYRGKGFPAETKAKPKKENTGYTVVYQLPGSKAWETITRQMITNQVSSANVNLPTKTPEGLPIQQMQYKYIEESGLFFMENETTTVYVWGVIKINDQIIAQNICIIDRKTGKTTFSTTNVEIKITHWAELGKCLGIVAGIATTVGLLVFWAPGVIIAATPGLGI